MEGDRKDRKGKESTEPKRALGEIIPSRETFFSGAAAVTKFIWEKCDADGYKRAKNLRDQQNSGVPAPPDLNSVARQNEPITKQIDEQIVQHRNAIEARDFLKSMQAYASEQSSLGLNSQPLDYSSQSDLNLNTLSLRFNNSLPLNLNSTSACEFTNPTTPASHTPEIPYKSGESQIFKNGNTSYNWSPICKPGEGKVGVSTTSKTTKISAFVKVNLGDIVPQKMKDYFNF